MSAHTKLTPEVQADILAKLKIGLCWTDACRLAGVSESTADEWRRRGRGEDKERPKTPLYEKFEAAVVAAAPEAKKFLLDKVHQDINGEPFKREEKTVAVVKGADGQLTPVTGVPIWLKTVTENRQPNGKLALELLGRLWPSEFGKQPITVQGDKDKPLMVQIVIPKQIDRNSEEYRKTLQTMSLPPTKRA